MVVSCYLRNYKPNGKLFPIHPPFMSHVSSLMVWLWLMVHSTGGVGTSRYKGRALWCHFMGVVHVKVLCVASQKEMIQMGTKSLIHTPFETSSNSSLNLMCNQSIVRPLYTTVRNFDNEMLKALKTHAKVVPWKSRNHLCVDMGCQM
jgi:hypothetical protein